MLLEIVLLMLALGFVLVLAYFANPKSNWGMFVVFTGAAILLSCGLLIFTEGIEVYNGESEETTITTNSSWSYNATGWKTNESQQRNGTIEMKYSYEQVFDTSTQYSGLILVIFAIGCLAYAILPENLKR